MVKPITPKDVKGSVPTLPDPVIEAFNELIEENYRNGAASFTQSEVVERMVSKGLDKETIFKKRYLEIERIYRNAGWKVVWDRPGYNEIYEPTITFN